VRWLGWFWLMSISYFDIVSVADRQAGREVGKKEGLKGGMEGGWMEGWMIAAQSKQEPAHVMMSG